MAKLKFNLSHGVKVTVSITALHLHNGPGAKG